MDGIENLIIENAFYKDSLKIEAVKSYIDKTHMPWAAGSTELSIKSYAEKKNLFGNKYILFGYDYYVGGIYNPAPFIPCIKDSSPMVNKFDWREKHNAHLDDHPYHDSDPDQHNYCHHLRREYGNGWMTMVKNQDYSNPSKCYGECDNGCYLFSSLGVMEAVANLYFNHHYDLDLSEQYAMDCTHQGCYGGGGIAGNIFYKAKIEEGVPEKGIIDENSLPWADDELDCDPEIDFNDKLSIDNWAHDEIIGTIPTDSIKKNLLAHGPLKVALNIPGQLYHDIVLVGYGILNEDDVFYNWDGTIVLEMKDYPQYIGSLYWICKNSYGPLFGDDGYFYFINIYDPNYYYQIKDYIYVIPPVYIDDHNPNSDYERHCFDHDKDGYYNWGLGEFDPMLCDQLCENLNEDSNDDEKRIGPYDENYYGISVMPEIKVYMLKSIAKEYIANNSFFSFSSDEINAEDNITLYIENNGNAQLNLMPVFTLGKGKVEIINIPGASANFSISEENLPGIMVCMESENSFYVTYTGHQQGDLAKIKIYLDEDGDVPDFECVLVYNDCQPEHDLIEIAGDQRWDSFALKTSDYLILPGATLTVTSEVAMGIDADILIAHDGKLIIDGGRLTSACSDFWNGIDVWGDASKPQVAKNQGTVEIKNGGMIENADTAIATVRFINIYHYPSGGIIACKDAIFRNNLCDVVFYPYNNIHPVSHEIIGNISRFTRTSFETTDDFYDITHSGHDAHIKLDGIRGIRMAGCDFYNSSTQKDYSRGIGIESYNSGYVVDNYCTEDIIPCPAKQPCTFKNLDYGIRAFNSNGLFSIKVDSADFIDNYLGISMSLVNDASIIKNHFYLNADDQYFNQSDILVGIYTERCTRYQIEENKLIGLEPDYFELIGMHILNSLPEHNEVYNNSLSNLTLGIIAAGENRNDKDHAEGLCIKCNDFIDCITDVYVTSDGGSIQDRFGIATVQGLPGSSAPPGTDPNTMGAGNTFSDKNPNSPNYNFFNDNNLDEIIYTFQNSNLFKLNPLPSNNIVKIPDPNPDITFLKEMSCPSHLNSGGIQLGLEMSFLSNESEIVTAYSDTLAQYVDGGDTPGLTLDIQTSFPDDALDLRQQLLEESPYLSDTVIKTAIQKENVLLNAMVRDILLANPQSSKSADVLITLNNKFDPMPDYMMDEIMDGRSILGEKEYLESQKALHNTLKTNAFSNIIRYYKNDTLQSTAKDSVMAYLETFDSPETQYQLAFCKLNYEDSTAVMDILSNIPLDYDLTPNRLNTHEFYLDLFDILIPMNADSIIIDSTSYPILFSLMDETKDIPGIYARNVLITNNLITYSEPIYFPTVLKNESIKEKQQQKNLNFRTFLKVYPNPAKTYMIIEYYLENTSAQAFINISNIYGKNLCALNIQDKHNQYLLDTRNFAPGIYLITLLSDNRVLENQKFIIAR